MDKIEELQKKIRETSLVISRVPKRTEEEFIALANAEFCGDYGMLLHDILEQALEYQAMKLTFFENINMKLDNVIEILNNKPQEEDVITLLSGKKIKGGKNLDGSTK